MNFRAKNDMFSIEVVSVPFFAKMRFMPQCALKGFCVLPVVIFGQMDFKTFDHCLRSWVQNVKQSNNEIPSNNPIYPPISAIKDNIS